MPPSSLRECKEEEVEEEEEELRTYRLVFFVVLVLLAGGKNKILFLSTQTAMPQRCVYLHNGRLTLPLLVLYTQHTLACTHSFNVLGIIKLATNFDLKSES